MRKTNKYVIVSTVVVTNCTGSPFNIKNGLKAQMQKKTDKVPKRRGFYYSAHKKVKRAIPQPRTFNAHQITSDIKKIDEKDGGRMNSPLDDCGYQRTMFCKKSGRILKHTRPFSSV